MMLVINKRAKRDYEFLNTYQAGIVLTGKEVKSLRNKSASLKGAFVKIIGNEAFLVNAQITPYKFAINKDYDPKRTRKLLLRKKEIYKLKEATHQKGRTLVPYSFELRKNTIKLNFALARGKKQFEKRADLRKKAQQRDAQRELKQKIRL